METRTLGHTGPASLGARPRLHGHVGLLRAGRPRREPRHDPRRARRRHHSARHRRLLRHGPQRDADRRGAQGRPRRGADQRQVRRHARTRRAAGSATTRGRQRSRPSLAYTLQAARHRPHRHLPPGAARSERADRGHHRRDRRSGQGRPRPPHRPVRGRRGDDPPRRRRPSDRRPADRIFADLARHRGRDPADLPGARHRHHRLRRAVARADQRALAKAAARRSATSARIGPRFQAENLDHNLALVEALRKRGATPRASPSPRSPSPGCSRKATTSCR